MAQPLFRRYWVKVCGDSCFPQFSEDGAEYEWQRVQVNPDTVLFLPFTEELAAKVRSKGTLAVASSLPPIEIPVIDPGSLRWCRPSALRVIPHTTCQFCGAELDEGVEAVCPRCFATNHWYCDVCDEFKDKPKYDTKQNALCPDCAVPRGLMRINQIWENWEEKHAHYNVIEADGHRHLIFDFLVNR